MMNYATTEIERCAQEIRGLTVDILARNRISVGGYVLAPTAKKQKEQGFGRWCVTYPNGIVHLHHHTLERAIAALVHLAAADMIDNMNLVTNVATKLKMTGSIIEIDAGVNENE